MSIKIDAPETFIAKVANTRPDADSEEAKGYEKQVKPLGSRVTANQIRFVTQAITAKQRDILVSDKKALAAYADTGDAAHLSPEQNEALGKLVDAARAKAAEMPKGGESQKRRIWPRKVAAIVLSLDVKAPEPKQDEAPAQEETSS